MARSLANLDKDLNDMQEKLDHISQLAENIGSFGDGPQIRSDIQRDARVLTPLSQQIKTTIQQLRDQKVTGLGPYEQKFNNLSEKLERTLPEITQSLKDNPLRESSPQMTQEQIAEDDEMIEEISAAIEQICKTMREIKELTQKTHAELEKQHRAIQEVDKTTTETKNQMLAGNTEIAAADGNRPLPKKGGLFSRFKKTK